MRFRLADANKGDFAAQEKISLLERELEDARSTVANMNKTMQDEISRAVERAVQPKLSPSPSHRASQRKSPNKLLAGGLSGASQVGNSNILFKPDAPSKHSSVSDSLAIISVMHLHLLPLKLM